MAPNTIKKNGGWVGVQSSSRVSLDLLKLPTLTYTYIQAEHKMGADRISTPVDSYLTTHSPVVKEDTFCAQKLKRNDSVDVAGGFV